MKNSKKSIPSKANVKDLAIEKLRNTEGGRQPIVDIFDATLGFVAPNKLNNK